MSDLGSQTRFPVRQLSMTKSPCRRSHTIRKLWSNFRNVMCQCHRNTDKNLCTSFKGLKGQLLKLLKFWKILKIFKHTGCLLVWMSKSSRINVYKVCVHMALDAVETRTLRVSTTVISFVKSRPILTLPRAAGFHTFQWHASWKPTSQKCPDIGQKLQSRKKTKA